MLELTCNLLFESEAEVNRQLISIEIRSLFESEIEPENKENMQKFSLQKASNKKVI